MLMLHRLGIRHYFIQRIKIIRCIFPEQESLRFYHNSTLIYEQFQIGLYPCFTIQLFHKSKLRIVVLIVRFS